MPGHADHLLRRRDRHGRQHLPRRPQRRAHAHAVEQRPQRRLLRRQPAAPLPAGHHRPRVPLEAVNVEAQQQNPSSLLWWMQRLIALRQRYKAFGRGHARDAAPGQPQGVRLHPAPRETKRILCVFNLSRHVQCVELDLSEFRGADPVELFGNLEFPPVGELPYFITLGVPRLLLVLPRVRARAAPERPAFIRGPRALGHVFAGLPPRAFECVRCPPTSPSGAGSAKRPAAHHLGHHRRSRAGPVADGLRQRRRPGPLAPVATS